LPKPFGQSGGFDVPAEERRDQVEAAGKDGAGDAVEGREQPGDLGLVDGQMRGYGAGEALLVEDFIAVIKRDFVGWRNRLGGGGSGRRVLVRAPANAPWIRFASTSPDKLPEFAAVSAPEPVIAPINDKFSDPADFIAYVRETPPIEPHIGYMKELGLDFGWGPTAFMQWSLEHVHVLLGTPWWASLGLTALAIRLLLFRFYIGAADNAGRLATIKPHIKDIEARLDAAKQTRDMPTMMHGTQELRNVYAAAGIKMWKNFLPFLQVPLGYGMFRLTRNMADLPLPGLETGGTLWFHDLTVLDPYFILPMVTGTATFFLFKMGGETGAAAWPHEVFKFLQWGMPIITTLFTSFWPAALQLSFAFSSLLSLAQTSLFKQPWFRELLRIHPLPPPAPPPSEHAIKSMTIPTTARTKPAESEAPAQGLVGRVSTTLKKYVPNNQSSPSGGRTKAQIAEAKRYEEKRTREIQREKYEAGQERQRRRHLNKR
ncbi:MAG: hypothetical protein Q9184_004994, partial [Pyrenodesmia sp. 2 TL-2023]